MAIDPNKVLVMGLSSLIDRADPLVPNAVNHAKIVDPCREHSPAGDRDVPPTAATFSHDANFERCVPLCPGEEGNPMQDRMWETNGLPVAGETMIYMYVVPMGTLLRGWKWDVFEGVDGLIMEIVVATFGGLNGGTKEVCEEHVVGEIDMSMTDGEPCTGWIPGNEVLAAVGGSNDVFAENNFRVYLRIKAIDDPAQIKCARFQIHQLTQCLTNAAPLKTAMEYANQARTYPGLGGLDQSSPFANK